MKTNDLVIGNNIKNKIYIIRSQQVMLDSDLAELYQKMYVIAKAITTFLEQYLLYCMYWFKLLII